MKLYNVEFNHQGATPSYSEATRKDVEAYLAAQGMVAVTRNPDPAATRALFAEAQEAGFSDDDLGLEFYHMMIDTMGADA